MESILQLRSPLSRCVTLSSEANDGNLTPHLRLSTVICNAQFHFPNFLWVWIYSYFCSFELKIEATQGPRNTGLFAPGPVSVQRVVEGAGIVGNRGADVLKSVD